MAHVVFTGTTFYDSLVGTSPAVQLDVTEFGGSTTNLSRGFFAVSLRNAGLTPATQLDQFMSGRMIDADTYTVASLRFGGTAGGAPDYMVVSGLDLHVEIPTVINASPSPFVTVAPRALLGNDTADVGGIVSQFWGDLQTLGTGESLVYGDDTIVLRADLALAPALTSVKLFGDGVTAAGGSTFTAGDDVIDGTALAATTVPLTIFGDFETADGTGTFGDDFLVGGAGADTLYGDSLTTVDAVNGGNDSLYGDDGADTLFGGGGNDFLYGGPGSNTLNGGEGDDVLGGGGGTGDTLNGGNGTDIVDYTMFGALWQVNASLASPGTNFGLSEGDTYDSVEGLIGNTLGNVLEGDEHRNFLYGRAGGDELRGLGGADDLFGEDGNDNLDGGDGSDALNGGVGDDVYVLGSEASGVDSIIDSSGNDTITSVITRLLASYTGIENIALFGADNVNAVGNAGMNVLTGNGGINTLDGGGSNDTLFGLGGNDHIIGGLGGDNIDGGIGYDFARYDFATIGVHARLDNAALNTGEAAGDTMYNFEGLVGSQNGDILAGNDLAIGNQIYGLGGSDTIRGFGGADTLFGGAGADSIFAGAGTDTVWVQAADLIATQLDRVFDFTDGQDHLRFQGISAASATITDSQGGTLISFNVTGGQFLVFLDGITKAASADQIFFV